MVVRSESFDLREIVPAGPVGKFSDPDWTAKGERRAMVPLVGLATLWINTGTLCNITCRNCYIESSPTNDRLAYITAAEAAPFLAEAQALGVREIGFTGGEPFLNPEFLEMVEAALARGFAALILTNAMLPMQRAAIKRGLTALEARYAGRLALRVSVDHYTKALHETERGAGSWEKALAGLDWLSGNGFRVTIAGRLCWNESEADARAGYARLIAERGWAIDARDHSQLVLFPEMDGNRDVPEITAACWGILNKHPSQVMCATSRMVVKRKGAKAPAVLPCTLLPYDPKFEMGVTLAEAATADGGMFDKGAVKLCHPHCAKFCVLGGASCS
ncbi:MAG TPA: radical SAM protein [Hyphomicrobiaceae bacterium]|nr:radical SAM protein [Hyphomicrobiaceae bacterium]